MNMKIGGFIQSATAVDITATADLRGKTLAHGISQRMMRTAKRRGGGGSSSSATVWCVCRINSQPPWALLPE